MVVAAVGLLSGGVAERERLAKEDGTVLRPELGIEKGIRLAREEKSRHCGQCDPAPRMFLVAIIYLPGLVDLQKLERCIKLGLP